MKLIFITLIILTTNLHAEIVLDGTRKVYSEGNREVSLQLENVGKKPSLVQAWIDDGNPEAKPDQVHTPFIITPPVSRIEANKGQVLRIMALPETSKLNKDKESLFWLNVLDIPPKPNQKLEHENYLQLAIRSRIKFIYRPKNIIDQVKHAPEKLEWTKNGKKLNITNPTPYFITISKISINNDISKNLIPHGIMLEPFSKHSLNISQQDINHISYTIINDIGARIEYKTKI